MNNQILRIIDFKKQSGILKILKHLSICIVFLASILFAIPLKSNGFYTYL